MIEQLPNSTGAVLGFKLSGKLHDENYLQFVPLVESAIAARGKVRLLAQFEDFHGWDAHALWDDTVFSTKHCADVEKVAIVGDRAWEKWMAKVCQPFTRATVQYFDVHDIDRAWAWLAA